MPKKSSKPVPYPNEIILCACGCGQTLQKYTNYLRNGKPAELKYIHGHNTEKKAIQYNCDYCGKSIMVAAYLLKRLKRHFCSYECSGMYRRNKVSVKCTFCGSSFFVLKHREETASFCSKKCQIESTKILVRCNYCGKELIRQPSHASGRRYCTQECQHKWLSENLHGESHPSWEGGHGNYRSGQWRMRRKLALTRDGHRCRVCGSEKRLCVHHIKKYRKFDDPVKANALENLITLCQSCHAKIEPRKRNKKLNKELKRIISSNPYQMPLIV